MALKSNSKTVNAINIDVECFFKCAKENKSQIVGHGGRKRVIGGSPGYQTEQIT